MAYGGLSVQIKGKIGPIVTWLKHSAATAASCGGARPRWAGAYFWLVIFSIAIDAARLSTDLARFAARGGK